MRDSSRTFSYCSYFRRKAVLAFCTKKIFTFKITALFLEIICFWSTNIYYYSQNIFAFVLKKKPRLFVEENCGNEADSITSDAVWCILTLCLVRKDQYRRCCPPVLPNTLYNQDNNLHRPEYNISKKV
jgi:hypothetical protein